LRSLHRILGLLLAAPFLVWTATGLLFHLKPGWSAAYDMLSAERADAEVKPAELAPLPAVAASRVEAFSTVLGPMWRVTHGAETDLYDGKTARRISPLTEDAAVALARDAVTRSSHAAAYGESRSAATDADAVVVYFAGGPEVSVDRHTARLFRSGPDTRRIDWYYRVHYLQWTGKPLFDRIFAVVAIALTWVLTLVGIRLFLRRK